MKKLISKITFAGIEFSANSHDRKCILIINRMSIVLAILMLFFSGMAPILKIYDLLYFSMPCCVAFSLGPIFNHKGWLTFCKWYFTITPILSLIIICSYNSIELGDRFFFFTTATIPIILFRKNWVIYFMCSISLASFMFTSWFQNTHEPMVHLPKNIATQYYYFSITSVFIILFYVIRYFKHDSDEYERELEEKNDVITEKNKEITDSIRYAKRIQQALLPSEKYIDKSLKSLEKK